MQGTTDTVTKPRWLNKKINLKQCDELKRLLKDSQLHTVCQQALCPNISECFNKKVATFLILGDTCTRQCTFCAIRKGHPEPLDYDEPRRLAQAVNALGLNHVVITSVTRDDLPDGGACAFAETIEAIRAITPDTTIEVLVPDFRGDGASIQKVIAARPHEFAHNIETVPRLYSVVRRGSDYRRSLIVLARAKEFDKNLFTKSGIMVGLGESAQEVYEVFVDLRKYDCDFLSIGQYLAPSKRHYSVREYIRQEQFVLYKKQALRLGFRYVESGPYVRSSYVASNYIERE